MFDRLLKRHESRKNNWKFELIGSTILMTITSMIEQQRTQKDPYSYLEFWCNSSGVSDDPVSPISVDCLVITFTTITVESRPIVIHKAATIQDVQPSQKPIPNLNTSVCQSSASASPVLQMRLIIAWTNICRTCLPRTFPRSSSSDWKNFYFHKLIHEGSWQVPRQSNN